MQQQVFKCDKCGEECGTQASPLIYVVTGTLDDGKMAANVTLPPQIWEVLKRAAPRQDYCVSCFSQAFGLQRQTLDQYEELLKGEQPLPAPEA